MDVITYYAELACSAASAAVDSRRGPNGGLIISPRPRRASVLASVLPVADERLHSVGINPLIRSGSLLDKKIVSTRSVCLKLL